MWNSNEKQNFHKISLVFFFKSLARYFIFSSNGTVLHFIKESNSLEITIHPYLLTECWRAVQSCILLAEHNFPPPLDHQNSGYAKMSLRTQSISFYSASQGRALKMGFKPVQPEKAKDRLWNWQQIYDWRGISQRGGSNKDRTLVVLWMRSHEW